MTLPRYCIIGIVSGIRILHVGQDMGILRGHGCIAAFNGVLSNQHRKQPRREYFPTLLTWKHILAYSCQHDIIIEWINIGCFSTAHKIYIIG
jgi:hypothetical protein